MGATALDRGVVLTGLGAACVVRKQGLPRVLSAGRSEPLVCGWRMHAMSNATTLRLAWGG